MEMKTYWSQLWLLTRVKTEPMDLGYRKVCANGKVVRADTEVEARHLANECIYADGSQGISKPNDDQIWTDPDLVRCTELDSTNAHGILMLK
jgi:hypothetical protein